MKKPILFLLGTILLIILGYLSSKIIKPTNLPSPFPSIVTTKPSSTPSPTPAATQTPPPTQIAAPTVTTKPALAKKTTITCVKDKVTKKVTAVNPKCPTGYKKK